ncbi:hypothetical protein ACLOJK_013207 [Asimina triloba]
MELDATGGSQSVPRAVEFRSIGYLFRELAANTIIVIRSLFGEVANRGRVVRVREVTYNTPPPPTCDEPICKIDFSSMAPLHQTKTAISSSEHSSLPNPPPNYPPTVHQGTTGNMSSAMQWQIQANNTSGMAGEDVQGVITSNYSNAPTCLLQVDITGMAGYDVWSMLPSHLKGISRSCNTRSRISALTETQARTQRPFEWRNPKDMNWHPENEYNEDRSVAQFDYLNLGTTLCADPHLKAYNARTLHAHGTTGMTHSTDVQSSTSVLVHSSSIILPDYHVLKIETFCEAGDAIKAVVISASVSSTRGQEHHGYSRKKEGLAVTQHHVIITESSISGPIIVPRLGIIYAISSDGKNFKTLRHAHQIWIISDKIDVEVNAESKSNSTLIRLDA